MKMDFFQYFLFRTLLSWFRIDFHLRKLNYFWKRPCYWLVFMTQRWPKLPDRNRRTTCLFARGQPQLRSLWFFSQKQIWRFPISNCISANFKPVSCWLLARMVAFLWSFSLKIITLLIKIATIFVLFTSAFV